MGKISNKDIMAEDWEIVEEAKNYLTDKNAVGLFTKNLKEGDKMRFMLGEDARKADIVELSDKDGLFYLAKMPKPKPSLPEKRGKDWTVARCNMWIFEAVEQIIDFLREKHEERA